MAESDLYFSLLRVTAAQALRAAGLTTSKPSVLDAFTDITSRYLLLLAQTTRDFAELSNRPGSDPALEDVRAAMEHLGLIRPFEVAEDTRGVDNLIEWFKGPMAAEMRRISG
ncbi:hypothetical protein DFH27DRAFT_458900, partial [Peziza echinospora]